jgi:hypothetical protein
MLAAGAFLWMLSTSPREPDPRRGALKALVPYLFLSLFLLYPILMSDGDFYYGVIRSILWQRDVNTMDEGARYAHGWLTEQAPKGGPYGFPSHPFPIGPSLGFIPSIAAGHLEAWVRRYILGDTWLPLDGYSVPYLRWLAVGTAVWGGFFVYFGYLLLRLRYGHGTSLRAVTATTAATPVVVYAFRDCGFPHAQSLAALTFFFWVWLRAPERCDWRQVFLLSVGLSTAALMRWQNCLFAMAPVLLWWSEALHGGRKRVSPFQAAAATLGLGAVCLVFCFPQLVFFRRTGPDWVSLQHGGEAWFWDTPRFFSMCFDEEYGLWGWNPFYFVAGIGAVLYLAGKSRTGAVLSVVWVLGWFGLAYLGETHSLLSKIHLVWFFGLPLGWFLYHRKTGLSFADREAGRLDSALGLLFLVGALQLYIDASYIYYHGGADYGNRLVVDLAGLVLLGTGNLIARWGRNFSGRLSISTLWLGCMGWSLALLFKGDPKFTRSPKRLTELVAHTTPLGELAQGIGHLDLGYFFSGLWLFLSLALTLTAALVLFHGALTGLENSEPFARKVAGGMVGLSIFCSLWLWFDLRQVDACLYVDDRAPTSPDLVRQALNTELTPWFPPGYEQFFPPGEQRFHAFLSSATPEYYRHLPVTWPRPDVTVPYTIDKVAILSRYRLGRELPLGEPVAVVRAKRLNPPSSTDWLLRAGIETDSPTSLRLPASSPDWYGQDVSPIPRYFVAELPCQPTQQAEVIEISLLVPDATLEVGAIWFSRSFYPGVLSRANNPRLHRLTDYDRLLFGQPQYPAIPFPARMNPDVEDPSHLFPPNESGKHWDREFRYFADPWRLVGKVPLELKLAPKDGTRPPAWHHLDWREPSLEIDLGSGRRERFWVALVPGPRPPTWKGGPVAILEAVDTRGFVSAVEAVPGEEVAFWGEPYLPRRHLAYFERQGFYAPVGVQVVSVPGFADTDTIKLRVRLSSEAIETGASAAVVGITALEGSLGALSK